MDDLLNSSLQEIKINSKDSNIKSINEHSFILDTTSLNKLKQNISADKALSTDFTNSIHLASEKVDNLKSDSRNRTFSHFAKALGETLIASAVIFSVVSTFSFNKVSGPSMNPTFKNGDIKVGINVNSPIVKNTIGIDFDRFDIVTINVSNDKTIVKRVIGLPGDTIEYKNNDLYINGQKCEEDFISKDIVHTDDFKITVEEGKYFCLGDNRGNSADSRVYGNFSLDQIQSKIIFKN